MTDRAHARRTDPSTSHDAARSLTKGGLSYAQASVLAQLHARGPMTDARLVELVTAVHPRMSHSGIRTRRAELVAQGRVRDSGARQRLPSGRYAIVWEAVE